MLSIRKTVYEDLETIEAIFSHARKLMRDTGNPTQWGEDRPSMDLVISDIEKGNSYIIEDDGRAVATFAYVIGIEPTYLEIDGEWPDDDEYGTIHRIASDGTVKGVFGFVIEHVKELGVNIRIDTHKDNVIMRHLIEKNGFTYCGIIIVDDGTERLAYQKKV